MGEEEKAARREFLFVVVRGLEKSLLTQEGSGRENETQGKRHAKMKGK